MRLNSASVYPVLPFSPMVDLLLLLAKIACVDVQAHVMGLAL